MKKHCLPAFALFISLFSFANDPADGTAIIKGKVTTSDGKSAPEVTILIKGTAKGTTTDEQGFFEFRKLHAGNYTLQVSHLGFETIEQNVTVEENKIAQANIQLKMSNRELASVIITSNKKFKTGWLSPSTAAMRVA